jgi:S-adenosylmethionine hydrolase
MTIARPTITLLTDFGLEDEYVGVMKGVILSINAQANIVDITHHIARHRIRQAALVLNNSFPFFPEGSIHVVVVDPGVGGIRDIVCLKCKGHFFIAPNNGALSLVALDGHAAEAVAVTNGQFFLEPVSNTFHGRDIFAPVAAHLSMGIDISRFGRPLLPVDIHKLNIPTPSCSSGDRLEGEVVSVDHFGNLVTNIDVDTFRRFGAVEGSADLVIRVAGEEIRSVSGSYDAVPEGAPLAVFGSRNLLEISINQGDARSYFNVGVGQGLTLTRERRDESR